MKKNYTAVLFTLFLGIGLIAGIWLVSNKTSFIKESVGHKTDIASKLPEPEKLTHIDSLPYYQYKKIADSLSNLSSIEKDKNTLHPWGILAGLSLKSFIGFMPTFRIWYGWYGDNQSHLEKNYFLTLTGYHLDDSTSIIYQDQKFYVKNNKTGLAESNIGYLSEYNTVLIPVSQKIFNIGAIAMVIIYIAIGLLLLNILIYQPIILLVNVSRGNVFTLKNISTLFKISYVLLVLFLIQIIMPFLCYLFLSGMIPHSLSISLYSLIEQHGIWLLAGIIMLIIAKAFSKGLSLQKEQDLTI
jgi:hypothetical protein